MSVASITKNTSALFIGSILKMVFSFVFVFVAAWRLGLRGFGEYELSVHYLELFSSLVATAIGILLTREIAKDRSKIFSVLSSATVLASLLCVAGCVTLLVIASFSGYSASTKSSLCLVTFALAPAALAYLLEAAFVSMEVAQYVTIGTVVEGLVRVLLAMVLLFAGFGVVALVSVLVASRTCLAIFYLVCLRQKLGALRWEFSRKDFFSFVLNWRAFAIENWLSNLSNSLGVIILSAYHSESAAGLYFAALKVMRLGSVMATSYTNAVFPHMSRLYQQSEEALFQLSSRSLKYMLALVLPVAVSICVFADRVVGLLFSAEFAATAPILRITIWILLLQFVNPFLSHILFARGEQKHSMTVAIIRFCIHLPIAFALIPNMAGQGEAWASLAASACASIVYFYYVFWKSHHRFTALSVIWTSVPALILWLVLLSLQDTSQVIPSLFLGAGVYLALLIMLRIFSMEDVRMLRRP